MHHAESVDPEPRSGYRAIPFWLRILGCVIVGTIVGAGLHGTRPTWYQPDSLKWITTLILDLLKLLATPLIFVSILRSLISSPPSGKRGGLLMWLLMSNTLVAILIGLLVANVIQPGNYVKLAADEKFGEKVPYNLFNHLYDSVPRSFIDPFMRNDIIGILMIAVALGVAIRIALKSPSDAVRDSVASLQKWLDALFNLTIIMLKWVFEIVPLAVLATVIRNVSKEGVGAITSLWVWIVAVVGALLLMAVFYMVRLWFSAKVPPSVFLRGGKEAFSMAFGTASSAATLPVTFRCAIERLGVSKSNAGLGVMVGGTFNHDGTALYEAMAALMVAQHLGQHLGLAAQLLVVVMAVVASVGAAGIPEAGLVTMVAVFSAVGLPPAYIATLLTVDWLLDRCRTTINVMGDLASTCILQSKDRSEDVSSSADGEPLVSG